VFLSFFIVLIPWQSAEHNQTRAMIKTCGILGFIGSIH